MVRPVEGLSHNGELIPEHGNWCGYSGDCPAPRKAPPTVAPGGGRTHQRCVMPATPSAVRVPVPCEPSVIDEHMMMRHGSVPSCATLPGAALPGAATLHGQEPAAGPCERTGPCFRRGAVRCGAAVFRPYRGRGGRGVATWALRRCFTALLWSPDWPLALRVRSRPDLGACNKVWQQPLDSPCMGA